MSEAKKEDNYFQSIFFIFFFLFKKVFLLWNNEIIIWNLKEKFKGNLIFVFLYLLAWFRFLEIWKHGILFLNLLCASLVAYTDRHQICCLTIWTGSIIG